VNHEPAPPRPFEQLAFDRLPKLPPRPHRWHELPRKTLRLTTPDLGTVDLCYRVAGAGPPLLLVHGLMTTGYSWRYAWEGLAAEYTVYMPDLPGSGDSSTPAHPLTPQAVADCLGAFLDALDLRGCAAIGNSMGGYLTMWLALRQPGAMSRLLQLHGPAAPTPKLWALWAAIRLPVAPALLGALVRRDPHRWAHRNVHYWDESLKSLEEARTYGDPLATPAGFAGFFSQLRDTMDARALADFQRQLRARAACGAGLGLPLLLVYARRDPMVPPVIGDQLARILPDARLVRMDQASHFAHVDAVDRFVPLALRFLRGDPVPSEA
jgi:pimeloyl-ACP methyl ester carboxylesterase